MKEKYDSKPVILIVDDNPDNLSVLFDMLADQGFEILIAEDGKNALIQADYVSPDLILLDIMLPDIDGFEVCRRLKENKDTSSVPVIFMSALSDTVDKIKGLQLGAVDYITKPFQHEEVLARVDTHLTMQRLRSKLLESERRLSGIVESAMDAIITVDQEARIGLFNRAAERVFGCPAVQMTGESIETLLSEGSRQVLLNYLRDNPQGEKSALWLPDGQIARRADGETFPFEATVSGTKISGRSLYILILRDIGERRKSEAERQRLRRLNSYLEQELRAMHDSEELIGANGGLQQVMKNVQQVAPTDATVLIGGETGTGKELVAQAIHRLSARHDKIMVKLNCAAIPEGLVESELFGHEKGAFTGALTRKVGRFELADGGTLFLDEVGDLPIELQTKLLRVLQEGELERLGSTRTIKVNVRIVAATNRDLANRVGEGKFRADLYYRLNVFPVMLPPLRERRDDISALVEYFVHKYTTKYAKKIAYVPQQMMATLRTYHWPGNIRELQHVIERSVILTRGDRLAFDTGFLQAGAAAASGEPSTLEEVVRAHILKTLDTTDWRVSGKAGAAELLGLKPTTLESRMKRLGITRRPQNGA